MANQLDLTQEEQKCIHGFYFGATCDKCIDKAVMILLERMIRDTHDWLQDPIMDTPSGAALKRALLNQEAGLKRALEKFK